MSLFYPWRKHTLGACSWVLFWTVWELFPLWEISCLEVLVFSFCTGKAAFVSKSNWLCPRNHTMATFLLDILILAFIALIEAVRTRIKISWKCFALSISGIVHIKLESPRVSRFCEWTLTTNSISWIVTELHKFAFFLT